MPRCPEIHGKRKQRVGNSRRGPSGALRSRLGHSRLARDPPASHRIATDLPSRAPRRVDNHADHGEDRRVALVELGRDHGQYELREVVANGPGAAPRSRSAELVELLRVAHDARRLVADHEQLRHTGILLWLSTLTVSLPSTRVDTPFCPCEAIKIRSEPALRAVSMIAS